MLHVVLTRIVILVVVEYLEAMCTGLKLVAGHFLRIHLCILKSCVTVKFYFLKSILAAKSKSPDLSETEKTVKQKNTVIFNCEYILLRVSIYFSKRFLRVFKSKRSSKEKYSEKKQLLKKSSEL